MVRVCSQKYKTMLKICYFHIYIYISQIWLNLQLNHRHFGSITKLTQKKKKKKQCVTVTVRRGSCSGPLHLLPRRTHPSTVVDRDAMGTRNPVERSSRALCRASPCSRLLLGPHFSPFSLSLSLSLSLMSWRWTNNNNNSRLIYSALFDLCIPKKFHNKKFLLLLLWWWCWRSNVLELLDAQVLTRGAYLLTPTYAHTHISFCLSVSSRFPHCFPLIRIQIMCSGNVPNSSPPAS
jgi:hypothetical protein